MGKELNIAAILNEKPTETKLWSPMLGDCIYCYNNTHPEEIIIAFTDKNGEEKEWTFSYSGRTISAPDTAEVCLFPSKQMQDWSKFAWKKGDVLGCGVDNLCIFKKWENDEYTEFDAEFVTPDYSGAILKTKDWVNVTNENTVKQHISKVEEIKGGKLNLETLQIEHPKQEFKDGDIVVVDKNKEMNLAKIIAIYNDGDILLGFNSYAYLNVSLEKLNFCSEVLVCGRTPRLASEEENQQLFDALAKEGKRWNPDTKLFEDLPKKCEFKPMDWCLMKDSTKYWELCQFAYTRKVHGTTIYSAVGGLIYYKCIPYNDQTKHLLGTTDEWKGGEA